MADQSPKRNYISITIITVCLNAVSTIETALQSVLDQKYPKLEYIVVDGGSTDGTLDIITKYRSQLAHVISEPDNGIYDAFNKGIRLATGDIVGILNADDFYTKWTFSELANAYVKQPETDIFYGRCAFVNEAKGRYWVSPLVPAEISLKKFKYMPHPACFVTKKAYARFGLFDIRYRIAGDADFLHRCFRLGGNFQSVDSVLSIMRLGGVSNVSPAPKVYREVWSIWFRQEPFWKALKHVIYSFGVNILLQYYLRRLVIFLRLHSLWVNLKAKVTRSNVTGTTFCSWESLMDDLGRLSSKP